MRVRRLTVAPGVLVGSTAAPAAVATGVAEVRVWAREGAGGSPIDYAYGQRTLPW
ncbi:hypothetical protein AB0J82_28815 [Asanoa sp. NPDC049518]|uniref:hypothetical protein n=1 Tax=unclassified Asanoa TaxID=2685164 RepID=UPI0034198075